MNDEASLEPLPVQRAQRALRKLSTSTRPVVYGGNRIELLRSGEEYFPRLLAAIETAQQSIYIEAYIFELDDVGQKVSDALAAAAQRGPVHLLIEVRLASRRDLLMRADRRAQVIGSAGVGGDRAAAATPLTARSRCSTIVWRLLEASTSSTTITILTRSRCAPNSARASTLRSPARARWWPPSRSR